MSGAMLGCGDVILNQTQALVKLIAKWCRGMKITEKKTKQNNDDAIGQFSSKLRIENT